MTGLSLETITLLLTEKHEELRRQRHRLTLGARPFPRSRSQQDDIDAHVPIINARIAVLESVVAELEAESIRANGRAESTAVSTQDDIDAFMRGEKELIVLSSASGSGRSLHTSKADQEEAVTLAKAEGWANPADVFATLPASIQDMALHEVHARRQSATA